MIYPAEELLNIANPLRVTALVTDADEDTETDSETDTPVDESETTDPEIEDPNSDTQLTDPTQLDDGSEGEEEETIFVPKEWTVDDIEEELENKAAYEYIDGVKIWLLVANNDETCTKAQADTLRS